MITITQSQFSGTTAELRARVDSFRQALEDHKTTVGVPAPREIDLVEFLVASDQDFVVEDAPAPPTPPTPEQVKADQRAAIDAARNLAIETGSVAYGGNSYHTDMVFQLHLVGLITAHSSGVVPDSATHPIRTSDNRTVQLGIADIKVLGALVLSAVQNIWQNSFSQKDALK